MNDAQVPSSPSKRRFSCVASVLLLSLALLVGIFFLPTIMVGFAGGFYPSLVYSQVSPDDQGKLIITKRVIFPANEMADPSTLVEVRLQDNASGRILASTNLELLEESDLQEPHVEWMPEGVRLTGIDRRKERVFTLRRSP